MKIPKAADGAVRRFDEIVPKVPGVERRTMFGQPAAFHRGQLFMGVFGEEIFVRLNEDDRAAAGRLPGAHPFAPMAGRPMREYVVLPPAVLADRRATDRWTSRALAFVAGLPPKRTARRR